MIKARRILNADLIDMYAHTKREVYYAEYITVEELLNLLPTRTDILEEKTFIRVHQVNELCMHIIILNLKRLV